MKRNVFTCQKFYINFLFEENSKLPLNNEFDYMRKKVQMGVCLFVELEKTPSSAVIKCKYLPPYFNISGGYDLVPVL